LQQNELGKKQRELGYAREEIEVRKILFFFFEQFCFYSNKDKNKNKNK